MPINLQNQHQALYEVDLIFKVSGEYAFAILFLLFFAIIQIRLIWERAQWLKRRNKKWTGTT